MKTRISGTGLFAPPKVMTNADMAQFVDTTDEWIQSRTGIKTRHLSERGEETTVYMSLRAAHEALERSGYKAEELDMIIVATVTPDYRLPSAACLLQHQLNATNAFAYDVVAACAGSIYALSIGDKFIRSGACKKVLVVGAECLSSITNFSDRNTCVLFGDAASAAILEPTELDSGFIDIKLYSDGSQWQNIMIPAGGSKVPLTSAGLEKQEHCIVMNGRETYKFAVRSLTEAPQSLLAKHNFTTEHINHVVAHQANLRIIEAVASKLSVPLDKFVINIDRYANTSSASLLATFDEASRAGRFKPGDLVLMMAIGAGFTWGSALYRI